MVVQRLHDGLGWRYKLWRQRLFLLFGFRNGRSLLRAFLRKRSANHLTLWNGAEIIHPAGRTGLIETVLELWCDQVYTRSFYQPEADDVVVDAGANVGLFSIWLARRYPRCRVFALEPFPENFAILEKNLTATGCRNVRPFHVALGAHAGTGTMVATTGRSLDHRLDTTGDPVTGGVRIVTLNAFMTENQLETIDFLKMDIEGNEYDVFSTLPEECLGRINRMGIEYHDNLQPGTLAFLKDRLSRTHDVKARSEYGRDYGMLWAVRNA
jgi:FkbM family methyltransferase